MESLIKCNHLVLTKSKLCEGNGVFADKDFLEGDIIESGIARVLTNVDGHENPNLFTWSDANPNTKWALLSGYAHFYNALTIDQSNCLVDRNFIENTFKIIAKKKISKGEELTHTYKSLNWRRCFKDLSFKDKKNKK